MGKSRPMLRACFSQHFQGTGSLWKCPEKVTAGEHPSSIAGEKSRNYSHDVRVRLMP
ncbi:hypothetical protein ALP32_101725 [Pseudomonas avellanae]|uniref:Uncharacterized protein n=2 Tax=Pseudomonas syringae group TaxID=136849 RepID=A0A3M5T192_9PSED|nr:hypothetical protein ALO40_100991 [Pseudomonas syringae pv. viburni]RMU26797.1 hypothetical protein ALP32_101725 [Pseudomonas avellanae]